jgi:hypothetical protein
MRVVAAVSDPASAAWDDGAVKVAAGGDGWASMPPAWALPVTVAGDIVLVRQGGVLVSVGAVCA